MKRYSFNLIVFAVSFLSLTMNVSAIDDEIPIWPGVAPGSETLSIVESVVDRALDGACTENRAIIDVLSPAIIPFIPNNPNGTAVIICPGGAYERIVYDVEGVGIAEMYNELGITAFILKYRLPINNHQNNQNVPLQDAQRAIRYVKNFAANWSIDTSKIGIMGCSAGGHTAASLATDFDKQVYSPIDSIDAISARPYFLVELYPVISMEPAITHIGTRNALIGSTPIQASIDEFSAEKHVSTLTPPAFFARAADDGSVKAENCSLFVNALHSAGVSARFNTYLNGGHGKGICKATGYDFLRWVNDCKVWLDSMGLASYQASTDASLNNIKVNNVSIPNFHADTLVYTIELPAGTDKGPRVKAYVNSVNAIASVTNPETLPGTAIIDVSAHDTNSKRRYELNFTVEENSAGIDNRLNKTFRIYPNPAKDMITIDLNSNLKGAKVSILALNGSLLKTKYIESGELELVMDINDCSAGLYLLEILNDSKKETILFTKE